ncbi:HAD-IA family hydrolase [Alteromonas halophila]|uniref:Haloacid dehalogenase n=1 Tax=Alteromonas halophila TaxID=516698 RepID=A0A918MYR7_9ALTE|nr:HAD-IA family hydrolase [Alteromonas halophila]GGW84255.1 haloacid dehalogenase [Alteromonas halophila]
MRFFRPLATVSAVTFDLDDTLYNNEPVIRYATQQLQLHLKQHYPRAGALTPSEWQLINRALIAQTPALASDMGQLRLRALRQALQNDVDASDIHAAAQSCFDFFYAARSDFKLDDEVHTTLEQLSAQVPLIAITNGNVNAKTVGFEHYFTHILHASTARPMKPHPAMFEEAASLCGLAPQHMLHVGDNLEKDVMGAHRAGFQTAWFACNRPMNINREPPTVLPTVVLDNLDELLQLCLGKCS